MARATGRGAEAMPPEVDAQRYRELFRQAPVGQAIYDLEGRIVEANAALHEILAYPPGSLVGKRVLELTHPDDDAVTRQLMGRITRGEIDQYNLDKQYLRQDGTAVWCRINVVAIRGDAGAPAYYVALISDLTERREREQLLELALEQFRGVFAHAPIGLAILDEEARVLDGNPELSRILGRPRAALLDRKLDSFRPPEDLVAAPTDPGPLLRGERPTLDLKRRFTRPEGPIVHTRVTLTPLTVAGAAGGTRLVALVEDVTDRRRAEWERELAERRYRSMFEDAAVGQVITTLTGTVVDANPTFCTILDRPRDEVEGASLLAFAHPDDASLPNEQVRRLLFGDVASFTREQRFLRPDGSVVHAELHLAMGPGASGGPEHLVVQVADVTERRVAEERLAETLAQLEERNQDLEQFASVASHDLKTPLQTILGFLELLHVGADGELNDRQRLYVERAMLGGRRMRELIDTVLNFARSGTQALTIVPLELSAALEDVRLALGSVAADGTVELSADVRVWSDRHALAIVLQNLVSNALKFTRPDLPPTVAVSGALEGDEVVIRVSDNGRGIAPEDRRTVFEMFARGAATGGISGSGIGLTTCRRLVERQGGRIWVEDSPLGGATVAFSLPVRGDG